MTQQHRFSRKLTYLAIAGVLGSVSLDAFANDFALTNNQFTVSNGLGFSASAAVSATNGVGNVAAINAVPLTSSFNIPNFSFNLASLTANLGTHTFQVGVSILEPSTNRRLEAYLGTLTIEVKAGNVVEGSIANQNLIVLARAGSLNASAVLTNNATNGPISINAGSVTFSGSNLVSRLTNASINNNAALFTNILDQFNTGNGSYTYNIVVQQTARTANSDARFGTVSGNTLTSFTPAATSVSNSFELNGTVANNPYTVNTQFGGGANAYRVTGTFTTSATSGGGGTATPPPVVDQQTLNTINNNNQDLQNAVNSGQITPAVENQATSTSNQAANAAQTLANAANSGTNLDPTSSLTTLNSLTTSASTSSQVAAGTNTGSTQTALIDSSIRILSSTATVVSQLATQGATLDSAQRTQLDTVVTNTLTTLDKLSETASSSTTQLTELVRQANAITNAKKDLGIPATAEQSRQVETIGRKLATAVITKVLTAGGQAAPTEEQITQALANDPDLFSAVIAASLDLPPTATEPTATTQQRIRDAFAIRFPTLPVTTIVAPTFPTVFTFNFGTSTFTPSQAVTITLTGEPATLALSNGRQTLALSASDVTVTQDATTGVVKIALPGESYSGTLIAIKSVPAAAATGITFLPDGRAVIVRGGYAIELAPTSVDQLAFTAAALGAGYTPTFRAANGSFSLALGGTQRFSGAFAYDNLTGKNLDSCGTISFTAPTGALNSPDYAFVATCSTGAVSQRITPFIDNADFFASLTGFGYSSTVDRSTGIITVTGVGRFKPSFFVDARTTADTAYYDANKNSLNMAFQGGDFNGDGKTDFKVISSNGVQMLYGAN